MESNTSLLKSNQLSEWRPDHPHQPPVALTAGPLVRSRRGNPRCALMMSNHEKPVKAMTPLKFEI